MTYWISLPSSTFKMVAREGHIVRADSIADHWIGRAAVVALEHYRDRGARIDWIKDGQ